MATLEDAGLPPLQQKLSKILGIGVTGTVFAIDDETVVKVALLSGNTYYDNESLRDIRIEREIYDRLGNHPRICRYIGPVNRGMVLEKLGNSLRKCLLNFQKSGGSPASDQALDWSIQAAEAIAYIHSKNVIQGDIGCYNFLFDQNGDLKLCDFGGSSIDGRDLRVGYGVRSQLWIKSGKYDGAPSIACELFALGSTIYEIWTTRQPLEELSNKEVENRYKSHRFADLTNLPVATVIHKCWLEGYVSADDVVRDLEALRWGVLP